MDLEKLEYRVIPITRYAVTRYHKGAHTGGCETKGEFDNEDVAYEVAHALCKDEHRRLNLPPGDERVVYPRRVENRPSKRLLDYAEIGGGTLSGPIGSSGSGIGAYKAADLLRRT